MPGAEIQPLLIGEPWPEQPRVNLEDGECQYIYPRYPKSYLAYLGFAGLRRFNYSNLQITRSVVVGCRATPYRSQEARAQDWSACTRSPKY